MKVKSVLSLSIFFFLVFAGSVFGQKISPQEKAMMREARLTGQKLQSCQTRENAIKNRATHLADLVTGMETKFERIAKRVQDYYINTVVPQGKTASNYDSLITDIQVKRETAQVALIKVHQDEALNFNCTASDPKAQMTQFREDMQAVKSALKDYRTSIKNLVVAVRSVTGEIEKEAK